MNLEAVKFFPKKWKPNHFLLHFHRKERLRSPTFFVISKIDLWLQRKGRGSGHLQITFT